MLLRNFEKAFWMLPFKLFPSTLFWVRSDGIWFACSLKRPHDFLIPLAVYEKDLILFVLNKLGPGSSFLDVGAHLGAYALRAARKVGAGGLVVGVEPDVLNQYCLQASISRNGFNNVLLIKAAVAQKSGFVDFYVKPKGDMSGLLCRDALGKKISVEAISLGALFKKLDVVFDVVKIDVEGVEQYVLDDLSRFRDFWRMAVVEVHGKSVGEVCGCVFCRKASSLGMNVTKTLHTHVRECHHVLIKNV